MKKIILTFVLTLSVAGPCFSQNNAEGMRILTINALMQYGQNLYDRGDYNEASAVFNHVLVYDSHYAQALQYLKDMGRSPAPAVNKTIDVSDTASLKNAIEAQKQVVEKLRAQVKQLRANIASQSAQEQSN